MHVSDKEFVARKYFKHLRLNIKRERPNFRKWAEDEHEYFKKVYTYPIRKQH